MTLKEQLDTYILCGGYISGGYNRECFNFFNGTWKSSPSVNQNRAYSASAVFSNLTKAEDDIIIITAGFNGLVLSTVESFDEKIWNQEMFMDLPKPIYSHCMIKINNSMLLLIGGLFEKAESSASSCTYFRFHNSDIGTTEKVVVVAGGVDQTSSYWSSVELLFWNDYKTSKKGWVQGPR
jgi:hypothetical protein